jgi:hypothetical protein
MLTGKIDMAAITSYAFGRFEQRTKISSTRPFQLMQLKRILRKKELNHGCSILYLSMR